jgi:hypothetical protein
LWSLREAQQNIGGVSIYSLRRHVQAGTLKSILVGGRILIPETEIDRVVREGLPIPRIGRPPKDTAPTPLPPGGKRRAISTETRLAKQ